MISDNKTRTHTQKYFQKLSKGLSGNMSDGDDADINTSEDNSKISIGYYHRDSDAYYYTINKDDISLIKNARANFNF